MSTSKLDELLKLPFEEYIKGCWDHVRDMALQDPVADIVAHYLWSCPAAIEATWARRYWFHKINSLESAK